MMNQRRVGWCCSIRFASAWTKLRSKGFTALLDAPVQPNLEAPYRTLEELQTLTHIRRDDDLLLALECGAARRLTVVA